LNDPYRCIKLLTTIDLVNGLSGSSWLQTGLIDYLLQQERPTIIPDFASPAMSEIIGILLQKSESKLEEEGCLRKNSTKLSILFLPSTPDNCISMQLWTLYCC
jgi:hypothetical protein